MNDILLGGGDENGRYRHLRHRTLNSKKKRRVEKWKIQTSS